MFHLHPDGRIQITQGDSAELDIRTFNKDHVNRRSPFEGPMYRVHKPKAEFPLLDEKGEFLMREIMRQAFDSENNPIYERDSEGNYIVTSEGSYIPVLEPFDVPTYPHDLPIYDSEGNEIYAYYWTPEGLMKWGDVYWPDIRRDMRVPDRWPWKYPSGKHPLQEERILHRDILILRVIDLQHNIILEKENDEFPNTIFFDKADTQYIPEGLYTYQLSYITDKDTDAEEEQTIAEGFFEVLKKFTRSEN